VNACLTFAIMYQDEEITTIEGLAKYGKLHPVQEAFLEHDGFQCGYCTSGQIMSAVALLQEPCGQDDDAVRECMSGNICRCGAYPNIIAAVQATRLQHILALQKLGGVDGQAKTDAEVKQKQYAIHSFGAHFCDVAFDPGLVRLRVTRWLTVIDSGLMINPKTARNQSIESVVMGIGMLEETIYDPRNGHPINNNYADYLVAVQTDIPAIECVFLEYPDTLLNAYGTRGIGEIGFTGCAATLTSATYHATSLRVRALPIRLEHLLV
jgi:xanthine dehydrogenase YagR molybdenum-binding subunit